MTVIDRGALVRGESRYTTAHLSNAIDDRYCHVEEVRGTEISRLAAESHGKAIDQIETIVREENIDCDFERVDGYLFLGEGHEEKILDEELAAAHRAGLAEVEKLSEAPVVGFSSGPCLRFPRQGQFHPLKYLSGLIRSCEEYGVRFFGNTPALDISGGTVASIRTGPGFEIRAQAVVVATHSPINHRYAMHTKEFPYRTYAVGFLVKKGAIERALYWDTLDPYHYVRLQKWRTDDGREDHDLLIVGGEDHKTGQAGDAAERFARLEEWTRSKFPAAEGHLYRWSGQVMETLDGLAYIGPDPAGEENVFVVTGDSGMGLTHGTIAGVLLTDLIVGKENGWSVAYDPSRKPAAAASRFAEENLNVATRYRDWLTAGSVSSVEEIAPGSGAVMRKGAKKLAVYRDRAGGLHARSAVCPHLGCIVGWNAGTKTWDCPCHGSRFDSYGDVLNGPATKGLTDERETLGDEFREEAG